MPERWVILDLGESCLSWTIKSHDVPKLGDFQMDKKTQYECVMATFNEKSHPQIYSVLCIQVNKPYRIPQYNMWLKYWLNQSKIEYSTETEWGLSKAKVDEIVKDFYDQGILRPANQSDLYRLKSCIRVV